ncbi:MAG: extracellular solute-binding protein [Treponema sp.]|nr:extracellular solute-binding protein [Treponema sp.]
MKKNIVFVTVLATLLALAMVFATTSCDRRPVLRIYNWTYYTPETVLRMFEQEFNVRVVYDQFASNEEMLARLQAGGIARGRSNFDLVFPSGDFVAIMKRNDWLEPMDHSLLPNLRNIDPLILEKTTHDPRMEFSVPYFYGAAGILVNTARVPDFERCWSIFAREDLRGHMTMLDDMREVMGGALSYLGYSVNSWNPSEIAAARDHIISHWRPNLIRFDSEAFGIGFSNGDFWVVHGFPEVVFEEIAGNHQLMRDTYFFIPPGAPAYVDSMVIPRGARNVELAHKFINFIHRPEIYAEFVDTFNFPASVNIPAREYTTATPMFTVEDLRYTELVLDAGPAFRYFNDAWFDSIRVE